MLNRLISHCKYLPLKPFQRLFQTESFSELQKTIKKYEKQVEIAQAQVNNLKQALTIKWFVDRNCKKEGELFLKTGKWPKKADLSERRL